MPVTRLILDRLPFLRFGDVEAGAGFVLLFGENGAGKTNLLEAVSLLTPGRGLRGRARRNGARGRRPGGVRGRSHERARSDIGTGTQPTAPERRQVRINGAPASVNSLSEWLSILWLTPAMDRLSAAARASGGAFSTGWCSRSSRATRTIRRATKPRCAAATNCSPTSAGTPTGSRRSELAMAEHGRRSPMPEAHGPRARRAAGASARRSSSPAPRSRSKAGPTAISPPRSRPPAHRDAAAGRATEGPHRHDLAVTHLAKQMPAARSSTGEQKALLLGLVLAHAELVAERRGAAADPAPRRGRRASRSGAPRGAVRPAGRARTGVDDGDRSGAVRWHRRGVALPRPAGRDRSQARLSSVYPYIALQHEALSQAA